MNATNTAIGFSQSSKTDGRTLVSEPISGDNLTIGSGFKALSFRAQDVGETMDPLVLVDHYVMTEPTFGVHPHAGMSAVSLLFDDSLGLFHNRDSLGNDFDLQPGDLYWLSAGSGALHDESPRANARTHGLQVFINTPQVLRFDTPTSLLVRSGTMPIIEDQDYRVKVALGESNGICGAPSPTVAMTILDGTIQADGRFRHKTAPNQGIWVHAVAGTLHVVVGEDTRRLMPGQAIAIKTDGRAEISIRNPSREPAHFAMFDGAQISETYVQDGPFVMDSEEQIAGIKAAYESGQLGSLTGNS